MCFQNRIKVNIGLLKGKKMWKRNFNSIILLKKIHRFKVVLIRLKEKKKYKKRNYQKRMMKKYMIKMMMMMMMMMKT